MGPEHTRCQGPHPSHPTLRALQAYRALARRLHPDKGGTPAAFARVQAAYYVLSDPRRRQVYDTWARELQFRRGRGRGGGIHSMHG